MEEHVWEALLMEAVSVFRPVVQLRRELVRRTCMQKVSASFSAPACSSSKRSPLPCQVGLLETRLLGSTACIVWSENEAFSSPKEVGGSTLWPGGKDSNPQLVMIGSEESLDASQAGCGNLTVATGI